MTNRSNKQIMPADKIQKTEKGPLLELGTAPELISSAIENLLDAWLDKEYKYYQGTFDCDEPGHIEIEDLDRAIKRIAT